MKIAGYSAPEMREDGFTAKKIRVAGYSAADALKAGWGAEAARSAGYEASELHAARCSARELRAAGFTLIDLRQAGYPTREVLGDQGSNPAGRVLPAHLAIKGQTLDRARAAHSVAKGQTPDHAAALLPQHSRNHVCTSEVVSGVRSPAFVLSLSSCRASATAPRSCARPV